MIWEPKKPLLALYVYLNVEYCTGSIYNVSFDSGQVTMTQHKLLKSSQATENHHL